jgi:uncharacterized protein (TIGR03435 family)
MRVDVLAKAASPAPVATLQRMLQPLLAEYFKVAVRREPRDMDVFAMVVANPGRLGPQLRRNDDSCDDSVGTAGGFARAPEAAPNQKGTCGILPGGAGRIVARGLDMPGLAAFIGTVPGRMVIDRTHLTGRFDIDLTYTPSAFSAEALAQRPGATPPPAVDPSGPPLITALREQLGLRLDPVRAPVEVLVIEHAEPLSVDEPAAGPAAQAPQPSLTAFEVASIRQNTSGTGTPRRTGDPARQGARPRFEVASIRQCGPNVGRGGGPGSFSPRQITINCQPVKGLIETAYLTYADGVTAQPQRVIRTPIEGGPGWITSDAFTISATTDGEATFAMMHGPMLQTLLEERFRLKVRRETREIPIYALTVASGGHKLKPFVEGSCVVREPDFTQPNPLAALAALPPLEPGQRRCMNRGMLKGSTRVLEADAITMSELTNFFIGGVDRPVIDRTDLTGKWVVRLEHAPTDRDRVLSANRGEPLESAAPSIFTALQEQLGLRLEPARGPGEYLVIETIERPTEN